MVILLCKPTVKHMHNYDSLLPATHDASVMYDKERL